MMGGGDWRCSVFASFFFQGGSGLPGCRPWFHVARQTLRLDIRKGVLAVAIRG